MFELICNVLLFVFLGKIFYFQPGHETLRSYYNQNVQLILRNAARWAARDRALDRPLYSEFAPSLEEKR